MMVTRLATRLAIWVSGGPAARRLRRLREQPDAGMETADKILWAAVITLTVSLVGGIFRDKLEAFANSLSITLGW